jgi:hypothetical protein
MTSTVAGRVFRAKNNVWNGIEDTIVVPGQSPDLPLPNLQRKPWHGGPAYFRGFNNPGLLTDTSIYPIFEFYLNFLDDSDATAEMAFGINGGVRVTANSPSNTNLQILRDTGLQVFIDYPEYEGTIGSETIAYVINDETDLVYGPGWGTGQGFLIQQDTESGFPQDGRIRFASYSMAGLIFFEGAGANAAVFVNGGDSGTTSPNGHDTWPQQIIWADGYWYAGRFAAAGPSAAYRGLSPPLIARSQNYGWIIDELRALQNSGTYNLGPKPIWAIVETGHPYTDGTFMLPGQFNGACWNSIIHEASGITLFVHDFVNGAGDPAWSADTQYAQHDNVWYSTTGLNYCACYGTPTLGTAPPDDSAWQPVSVGFTGMRSNYMATGMAEQVPATAAAIQALASVINTQTLLWEFNPELETMLKAPGDGHAYIFSMQNLLNSSGTYTLTLPPGITGTTVTVLNESRTINVSGGAFSDTFDAEYTVHIYKVTI